MKIQTCICTDTGIRKKVNQDAVMVKVADTDLYGRIAMGVLCDGMGGLSCGEVASAAFVHRMENWFHEELAEALSGEQVTEQLSAIQQNRQSFWKIIENQWSMITSEMNDRIAAYGNERGIRLGTTVLCLLLIGEEYLVMNIGDSRLYVTDETMTRQLTHDQSYVQQQIDLGLMTPQEALESDQKSVLLQCIGASEDVRPDFYSGSADQDTVFALCCDGFWRKQDPEEMHAMMTPYACSREENMKKNMMKLTDRLKKRGETDNISVLLISCRNEK